MWNKWLTLSSLEPRHQHGKTFSNADMNLFWHYIPLLKRCTTHWLCPVINLSKRISCKSFHRETACLAADTHTAREKNLTPHLLHSKKTWHTHGHEQSWQNTCGGVFFLCIINRDWKAHARIFFWPFPSRATADNTPSRHTALFYLSLKSKSKQNKFPKLLPLQFKVRQTERCCAEVLISGSVQSHSRVCDCVGG